MNRESITRLYTSLILLVGILLGLVSLWIWSAEWNSYHSALIVLMALAVAIACWYPFRLSPQAEASLFTVPLFMAVLLLHPFQAALAGAGGLLISEGLRKRPAKVLLFNTGVSIAVTVLGGIVFRSLTVASVEFIQLQFRVIMAALAAGVSLHVANLSLVAGVVTIRKGRAFWSTWKTTWDMDVVQEAGILTIGFLAALLANEAWWTVPLLAVPLVMAYFAFRKSVEETVKNAKLADELQAKMTELTQTQAQLVQSAKLASIGVLAAGVAHEVNNPMFAISGRAQLLMRSPEKHFKSEKAMQYVSDIQDMAQRVSNVVKELLDYSRPTDSFEPVSLHDAMDRACALVGKLASTRGVEILKLYEDRRTVNGIHSQLQQVFVNLLLNALDATPQGGKITLGTQSENGSCVAYVKDTGSGMSEEVLSKVFEPFFTTKEVGRGTGLGLFICHKIVTTHKGEISIKSKVGEGTTVMVKIPVNRGRIQDTVVVPIVSKVGSK